jgi:hypothetical protein
LQEISDQLEVEPVSDVKKLKTIQKEGVHYIEMNSTMFEASAKNMARNSKKSKLFSQLGNDFKALFLSPKQHVGDGARDDLSVKLKFGFNKKVHSEAAQRAMVETAEALIEDEASEGFTIQTLSGTKVRYDETVVSERVEMLAAGNSVHRGDAWGKLIEYYGTLKSNGILEQ